MKVSPVTAVQKVILPNRGKGKPTLEIERKFLVNNLPEDLNKYPSNYIVQGYLSTEEGTSIRLRKEGDKYYQTIKKGTGKVREEIEMEITKPMYDVLWGETKGRRIKKIRYEIPYGEENIIQLDIYEGKLKGLQTVEVEFTTIEACDAFIPPEWFGPELTDIKDFTNKHLATQGLNEKLFKKLMKKHKSADHG